MFYVTGTISNATFKKGLMTLHTLVDSFLKFLLRMANNIISSFQNHFKNYFLYPLCNISIWYFLESFLLSIWLSIFYKPLLSNSQIFVFFYSYISFILFIFFILIPFLLIFNLEYHLVCSFHLLKNQHQNHISLSVQYTY